MKNPIALAVFLFVIIAPQTFRKTDTSLLNVNRYFPLFSISRKGNIVDSDYVWEASDEEIVSYGALNWNGRQNDDTGLVDPPSNSPYFPITPNPSAISALPKPTPYSRQTIPGWQT